MICKWCAHCAEHGLAGELHTKLGFENIRCSGETWCDCQHKDPGTGINRELVKDEEQPAD